MRFLLFFLFVSIAHLQCRTVDKNARLTIEKELLLRKLPSASGVVLSGDSVFLVSDDAPFIFKMDIGTQQYQSIPLRDYSSEDYRIPKKKKPDFECAAMGSYNGHPTLFAFGSGSVSPQRDLLLLINAANPAVQQRFVLTALYRHMMKITGIRPEQWNLEGAVITGDTLLLMNRGDNRIMELSLSGLLRFLHDGSLPEIAHYTIDLPQQEGFFPRMSGGCVLGGDEILFCASIEDTPNWYTDGPVIGSGIGIFDRRERKLKFFEMIRRKDGSAAAEKVESVELLPGKETGMRKLLAVIDDDAGHSRLLYLQLRY